jgi:hypothetical protein
VSLPAGFGKNGLPLCIQVVGAYREDHHLLRVAKWIESTLKFDPGIPVILVQGMLRLTAGVKTAAPMLPVLGGTAGASRVECNE